MNEGIPELHLLPSVSECQEQVPIVGFRNGKSVKDYLLRAALPKIDNAGGSEQCGKGTCQVCDHIITSNTFTTKAYGKVFKIQSGPFNCNSEKVIYLLRCKICDDYDQILLRKDENLKNAHKKQRNYCVKFQKQKVIILEIEILKNLK